MKKFAPALLMLLAAFLLVLPLHAEAAVIYSEDFEISDGNYEATYGDWQWGTPTNWPDTTTPGGHCWGTVLNGTYDNGQNYYFRSVTIDLTGYPEGSQLTLTWKQAWEIESDLYEATNIYLADADTHDTLKHLWSNGRNWAAENGWQEISGDISAAAGHVVKLHFDMYDMDMVPPGEPTPYKGLYIDDIVIEGPELTTYTIATTAGSHGTVSPDVASVDAGEDLTITVTPDEGYELHHMEIEISGDVSFVYTLSGDSYTFEDVSNDISLNAYFRLDEQMLADAGLDDMDIASESFALSIPGSPELPGELTSDDFEPFSFNGVGSPDFAPLSSGDLPEIPEVRELFLQGLSFDFAMEASSDAEMPIMVTRMTLVVSRDVLGEELCASIDQGSEAAIEPGATFPGNIADDFFRYIRLYKIVDEVPCDLYALGQEEHPDEGFFYVTADENAYYMRFTLALVDRESEKAPAVQALVDGEAERALPVQAQLVAYDGFFFVFDGEADGHFRDPLVLGTIPEEPIYGSSGGNCNVGFSPASALFLLPLLGLLKKR